MTSSKTRSRCSDVASQMFFFKKPICSTCNVPVKEAVVGMDVMGDCFVVSVLCHGARDRKELRADVPGDRIVEYLYSLRFFQKNWAKYSLVRPKLQGVVS